MKINPFDKNRNRDGELLYSFCGREKVLKNFLHQKHQAVSIFCDLQIYKF